jgi:hypothetical protein
LAEESFELPCDLMSEREREREREIEREVKEKKARVNM